MFNWHWHIEWQTPYEFHGHGIENVIISYVSKYQKILIANLARFGKTLIIDGKIQSTVSDEFIYHETLVHPLLISLEYPQRVLILGGGEGATLREVLKHKSVKEVVMVDIDESVVEFAKRYLEEWHKGAFNDPRAKIVIADGYEYVKNSNERFDAVILDLTDPQKNSPSVKLYTKEFYVMLKKILNPKGGIVTQATSPSFSLEVFSVIYNTLKQVFRFVSPAITYVPSFDGLWGFINASDSTNVSSLTAEDVNKRIHDRIVGNLLFYDGTTHLSLFNIPKYIRKVLDEEKRISTESSPIYTPA
ncbi:MAG: polyamine aminopropyltransferase [Sulfolobaceae archaeon]